MDRATTNLDTATAVGVTIKMADQRYNREMSNVTPRLPPSPTQPPWPPAAPVTRAGRPQWASFTALAIALVAVALAIGAWFRPLPDNKPPSPPAAPNFSARQVADAKTKVCAAYDRIHHAVLANTGRSGGTDPVSVLGLAANARLALYDGGQYLAKALAQAPAAPADLAAATRALVDAYQELAVNYMAEATDAEIQSSFQAVDSAGSKVSEMCK